MNDYNNYPDVDVALGEWESAISPQTIGTTALGPCIGVVLYGNTSKEGYVGHFVDAFSQEEDVNQMIAAALHNNDSLDVVAWLFGGCTYADDDAPSRKSTKNTRRAIKQTLEGQGIVALHEQWNNNGDCYIGVILDCETGEVSTQTHFID